MPPDELELLETDPSEEDESDLQDTGQEAVLGASDWTVETLVGQLRNGRINLNPSFQRREAWTDDRKGRFIESLFLGMPIPQLVLAEDKERRGSFIVIDGKQRLLAIRRFFADESDTSEVFSTLRLRGLQLRHDLEGRTLNELRGDDRYSGDVAAFENQTIRTVVIKNWRRDDFLYRVFLRLNTGSLPLSPQELRQALHPGPFVSFVDEYSADSQGIRTALGLTKADFRMRDAEILIRFFAFSKFLDQYTGDLKRFLDNTCSLLNKAWSADEAGIRDLATLCDGAIETTVRIFGEKRAFTRWSQAGYERRFNRAVFDLMTFYFQDPSIAQRSLEQKDAVREAFEKLSSEDRDFTEAVQSTTKSITATFKRLRAWGEALQAALGIPVALPELVQNRIRLA